MHQIWTKWPSFKIGNFSKKPLQIWGREPPPLDEQKRPTFSKIHHLKTGVPRGSNTKLVDQQLGRRQLVDVNRMVVGAHFRFFNSNLRTIYNQCPLPAKQDFPSGGVNPPNAIRADLYGNYSCTSNPSVPKGSFLQSYLEPPAAQRPNPTYNPELSKPFYVFGSDSEKVMAKGKRRKRDLDGHLRVYKVRMVPTADQIKELKRCFSAARHAYNWAVGRINNGPRESAIDMKKAFTQAKPLPDWADGVARQFVDGAILQAAAARDSAVGNLRAGNITHFKLGYMSHKKTRTEVLRVDPDQPNFPTKKFSSLLKMTPAPSKSDNRAECLAFFGNNLKKVGGIRLQDKRRVIDRMLRESSERLQETCQIHWDKRTRQFHFHYVYQLPRLEDPDPEFETKRIVATDPGVRRFQTYYSPTGGDMGTLLKGQRQQVEDRCAKLDQMCSKLQKRRNKYSSPEERARRTRNQRRRTYQARERKLTKEFRRTHEWMKQSHYAAANFLLSCYDIVIAPKLETAKMVPRNGRVFGSKTARAMLTWSHGYFTDRLHSVAVRYPGRTVLTHLGEPGTSKTCTHCGHWHADLGASKVFNCPQCGLCIDRDLAGARNNFLASYGMVLGMGAN